MKISIITIALVLNVVGLCAAHAGQVDPRFRGVWVGEEKFEVYITSYQYGHAPVYRDTTIAIGEGGKLFGVLKGMGPGRYSISPWSNGNKLRIKHLPSPYVGGRYDGEFVLSADGNTITEIGNGCLPSYGTYVVNCNITGTFHRQTKK